MNWKITSPQSRLSPNSTGHSFPDDYNNRMDIPVLAFCGIEICAKKPLSSKIPKSLRTLEDHIRKRRIELELLQEDMAKMVGVSTDFITGWENNRSTPQIQYIHRSSSF